MSGQYTDGSYTAGKKELVVYFVILRMPDEDPKLLKKDYVFTDSPKRLERRVRFETPIEPHEVEYLEIIMRPIEGGHRL